MNLQLTDKVAIVTGSSRGLGLATATTLVEEACSVTICARGGAGLSAATDALRSLPGGANRVLAVQADVSTVRGVADVVQHTVAQFGGVDILVNNVGAARGSDI